ncbi:alpha/beta fold hydrolase [Halomicrococcus gelatinilyticus]|uniref:alpha/beta fold hydrolase n=1 Tax=Halomicrococcus gelatinilyticus TaxID=1702103 RepID=UPI002E0D7432
MPTVTHDGVELYYDAEGPSDRDAVAFVADVGYGAWQWGWQHAAVAGPFESLVWDLRGTGRSDAPPGPYSVEALAADLEAVLADHGVRRAHVVGAGLGGMVALQYALDYSRARTLALVGTSPGGPQAVPTPEDVREQLLVDEKTEEAMRESLRPVLSEEFFAADPAEIVEWRLAEDAAPDAQRAQFAAMDDFDVADRLHEITVPALVLHGTDDRVVPVENGRLLAANLPRGELRELEGAPHLAFVEQSRTVNDELLAFLESHAETALDGD